MHSVTWIISKVQYKYKNPGVFLVHANFYTFDRFKFCQIGISKLLLWNDADNNESVVEIALYNCLFLA